MSLEFDSPTPRPFLFSNHLAQVAFAVPYDYAWTEILQPSPDINQILPTVFRLQPGHSYLLRAVLTQAGSICTAQWVDSTNNPIGPAVPQYAGAALTDNHPFNVYAVVGVIGIPLDVKVRVVVSPDANNLVSPSSYVYIEELN